MVNIFHKFSMESTIIFIEKYRHCNLSLMTKSNKKIENEAVLPFAKKLYPHYLNKQFKNDKVPKLMPAGVS